MREKLENYGFEINPYNSCFANDDINGSQMTVTLHMDNLKVSHVESSELQKFGQYLRDNFGNALMEHTGDVHDYLGIDIN